MGRCELIYEADGRGASLTVGGTASPPGGFLLRLPDSLDATLTADGMPIPRSADFGAMGDMNISMSVKANAWHSNVKLLGLQLPNWFLVIAAVAIAVCAWLDSTGQYRIDRRILIAVAVYGIIHTAFFLFTVMRHNITGIGAILALVAFIATLVILLRERKTEEEAYEYTPPESSGE